LAGPAAPRAAEAAVLGGGSRQQRRALVGVVRRAGRLLLLLRWLLRNFSPPIERVPGHRLPWRLLLRLRKLPPTSGAVAAAARGRPLFLPRRG